MYKMVVIVVQNFIHCNGMCTWLNRLKPGLPIARPYSFECRCCMHEYYSSTAVACFACILVYMSRYISGFNTYYGIMALLS